MALQLLHRDLGVIDHPLRVFGLALGARTTVALDFDRVIVAHGRVLDSGGQAALRAGFDWLLGQSRGAP